MTARDSLIRPLSWPLLALPDAHGQLAFPSYEDSVQQMIRVILLTRPGEQLNRPEFGAGISRFLHEPNTVETRRQIRATVLQALTQWEPRIALDEVDVSEVDGAPTAVRIDVFYQLVRTGQRASVTLAAQVGG
jgi:phage baseplate assembly protein W